MHPEDAVTTVRVTHFEQVFAEEHVRQPEIAQLVQFVELQAQEAAGEPYGTGINPVWQLHEVFLMRVKVGRQERQVEGLPILQMLQYGTWQVIVTQMLLRAGT